MLLYLSTNTMGMKKRFSKVNPDGLQGPRGRGGRDGEDAGDHGDTADENDGRSPEECVLETILRTAPISITAAQGEARYRLGQRFINYDPSGRKECAQCHEEIGYGSSGVKFTDSMSPVSAQVSVHDYCQRSFETTNPVTEPEFPWQVELPTTVHDLVDSQLADTLPNGLEGVLAEVSSSPMNHHRLETLWTTTLYVSDGVRDRLQALMR
jgi:hypothetical protein